MSANVGFALRVAMFVCLYLFLFLALRIIWKSVTQKDPRVSNIPVPTLQIFSSEMAESTESTFTSAEVLIGRDHECDFVINHPAISARHGRFSFHQNQWWYEDLKSTNGSFLEDLRIEEPIVIKDGDNIYCGDVQLKIKITPNS